MNKRDFIKAVAGNCRGGDSASDRAIDATLRGLTCLAAVELDAGRKFAIPGIGTLTPVDRAERQGRNPATGAAITIPARVGVTFKLAKSLKEAIQ